jgi:hypothetical protein
MRYFKKQPDSKHIPLFDQWKSENSAKIQEWIQSESKKGGEL